MLWERAQIEFYKFFLSVRPWTKSSVLTEIVCVSEWWFMCTWSSALRISSVYFLFSEKIPQWCSAEQKNKLNGNCTEVLNNCWQLKIWMKSHSEKFPRFHYSSIRSFIYSYVFFFIPRSKEANSNEMLILFKQFTAFIWIIELIYTILKS